MKALIDMKEWLQWASSINYGVHNVETKDQRVKFLGSLAPPAFVKKFRTEKTIWVSKQRGSEEVWIERIAVMSDLDSGGNY